MDSVLDQRVNDVLLQIYATGKFNKFPAYLVQVEVVAIFNNKPKFKWFIQTVDDIIDYVAFKLICGGEF